MYEKGSQIHKITFNNLRTSKEEEPYDVYMIWKHSRVTTKYQSHRRESQSRASQSQHKSQHVTCSVAICNAVFANIRLQQDYDHKLVLFIYWMWQHQMSNQWLSILECFFNTWQRLQSLPINWLACIWETCWSKLSFPAKGAHLHCWENAWASGESEYR